MASSTASNQTADGLGGILALIQAFSGGPYGDMSRAQQAAGAADPFAGQRGQYQQQLQGLMSDPSSFKTDPGYQFALDQGQQGIENASGALYGTRRTGALAPELAQYTEGYANKAYSDRINQLMTLSGATTGSPGAAGALLAGGQANQSADAGAGIAGLLSGLGGAGGLLSGLGGLGQSLIGKGSGFGGIDWSKIFGGSNTGTESGWPGDFGDLSSGDGINWDQLLSGDSNFDWGSFDWSGFFDP